MGWWSIQHSRNFDRKRAVNALLEEYNKLSDFDVSLLRQNPATFLFQRKDEEGKIVTQFISFTLLEKQRNGDWFEKEISEDMGPFQSIAEKHLRNYPLIVNGEVVKGQYPEEYEGEIDFDSLENNYNFALKWRLGNLLKEKKTKKQGQIKIGSKVKFTEYVAEQIGASASQWYEVNRRVSKQYWKVDQFFYKFSRRHFAEIKAP